MKRVVSIGAAVTLFAGALFGQFAPPPPAPLDMSKVPAGSPEPKTWTAAEDQQNMMEQLGIKALRPGPSGNEQAPNHANYDESLANPFPDLPDVLTMKNGKKATSAGTWRQLRAEIIAIERTFPELALAGKRRAVRQAFQTARRRVRTMTEAEKKAVSERMKKYWAERRKAKAKVK